MAKTEAMRARLDRNRAFVAEVNARTVCAHCGAQPVEWHNPEHVELNRKRFRISAMAGATRSLAAIQNEMSRCTPLCRRCHMAEDGRLRAFIASAPHPVQRPKPCSECGREYKPLRRGLCSPCYLRRAYHQPTSDGKSIGAVKRRTYEALKRNGRPRYSRRQDAHTVPLRQTSIPGAPHVVLRGLHG